MALQLENDHNVYILGAGFSRDASLPLVNDFLLRMRDCHEWLAAEGRSGEAEAVADVLEYRLRASSAAYWTHLDLENIEELFSLVSSTPGSLSLQVKKAIAATLDYAEKTSMLEDRSVKLSENSWASKAPWITRDGDQYKIAPYVQHVGKLLGMMRNGKIKGRNTFITFNYDTILEDALDRLDVPYDYCFRKQKVNYKTRRVDSKNRSPTKVVKLHGSINWGRRAGKWSGRALTIFDSYEALRESNVEVELIPPTWKKVFQNQMSELWEDAVSLLQGATRICIIGFSIPPTDLHFRYLLAAGLRENVSLRSMTFCNPMIEEVKDKVSALLRRQYMDTDRIRFFKGGLEEFCASNQNMGEIGRPWWVPGDKDSLQFTR
jgi:hypothetical protein